eukprot:CAMPEP_0203668280 /NCGR_PEP_ID=MMETSP0090-20130426/4951_1 /ASSEMBLY_ACC=CAM_ASM_001088 /TAXON_ID=426623 /ORGANISM="Chaetoceros affinis, Strain CCMP159" /LENGTH=450 /DNA_ID=CAMNT_0050532679 /DNA_START=180 /DNA_END=1532 /DNA_ORIENTATION=-
MTTSSSSSSSSSSTTDPASMINCTIKIQNVTSKPELNSQIGIVQSYNTQNNRYIIQITSPPEDTNANGTTQQQQQLPRQVCVALKIENIKQASTVDKLRGQYYIFLNVVSYLNKNKLLWWNDAKTKFNFTIQQLVRSGVLPSSFLGVDGSNGGSGSNALKFEYIIGSIVVALLAIIYKVGLTKTIFFFSVFGILLTVAFPDLMTAAKTYNRNMKDQLKMVAANFPIRWREMILSHSGYNVNPRIANGLLIALLLLSGKILFTPLGTKGVSPSSSGTSTLTQTELNMMKQDSNANMNINHRNVNEALYTVEEIYKLGFEDASNGKDFGLSLPESHETLYVTTSTKTTTQQNFGRNNYGDNNDSDIQFNYDDYQPTTPPVPPAVPPPNTRRGSGIGFGTLMSMFALFRSVKEMGFVNGRFEFQYFISNVQSMPPMKMAFMGFMVYRVISAFV